ncbi:MAG TPA: ATP-binding cassette domain-containing protein [Candidatus Gemmiger excrementavium]|uniref:ATP-binding cassette domain-containing protein n=1 Tax=Candidatus Gemmiger excrementavium TaxID=2838608 RepID=A0A9D2F3M4_9FIRM|nr:ATP-binding cassette domain-containing protein [Candidatus Gemmiger excrementavium]
MNTQTPRRVWRRIFALLPQKQKLEFFIVLLILGVSAVLSQVTPLTIGYLTDHVLAAQGPTFSSVLPILLVILLVNVVNEVIKVIRRLIVEDAATQAEKNARQQATLSLLLAPLAYFRGHMTGNIHGRLNRSLEGTVKLIKLLFMDFAPAVTTGLAAIVTIFWQLPFGVACLVILVIPVGTFIVFRQISTQKGIRVELMETKADIAADIEKLPGSYDFMLAEGGTNLSGGQRQRIALARVFLRNPRILILDEATSALDNTSEKHIQQEIEAMKAECGTTVISIAHRLTTLQNCDEILVMDQGRIVQRGTFRQLEETPGIFRDMARGILK